MGHRHGGSTYFQGNETFEHHVIYPKNIKELFNQAHIALSVFLYVILFHVKWKDTLKIIRLLSFFIWILYICCFYFIVGFRFFKGINMIFNSSEKVVTNKMLQLG